jgi:cytochrome c oxidase subunit 2
LVGFVGVSCGAEESGSESSLPGRQIAASAGCLSCHGSDFSGGIGPSWIGLAGSEVKLSDGSSVTADRDYLFESIRDPGAKLVAGYSVAMPRNSLSDEEISQIVDLIESLSSGDR